MNNFEILVKGGHRKVRTSGSSPFVSIITVVYNSDKLLPFTIESIKNQTSKDYEFIIIDGGSKDQTLDIIQQNEEVIDYWISEKDEGIYDGMNKGILAASGRYIWFINSGDEIEHPDTLARIISLDIDADIYFGETNFIDPQRKVLGTRSQLSTRKLPGKLTWKSLMKGMVVSHQSIIVKKSIAQLYQLDYKCSADIDWVIDALKKSQKTINTHLVLSKYLVGGYSLKNSRRCWKERYQVYLKYYGTLNTLLIHLMIVGRAIFHKISGKPNY